MAAQARLLGRRRGAAAGAGRGRSGDDKRNAENASRACYSRREMLAQRSDHQRNNGSSLYGDCPGASGGPNTINVAGTQTLTTYYDYYNGYNTGLPLIKSAITIQ